MKIQNKTKLVLSFLLIAILALVSACGGGDAKTAQSKKKVVNIGIMNAPVGLIPLETSDISQNLITSILFLPLLELNDDMNYVPQLADAVETQDNQNYTVKLNPKAKWTDGQPVTADDVIFTLKLITHPNLANTAASRFSILEGVNENGKRASADEELLAAKKIDANTLVIKTKKPVDKNLFYDNICRYLKTVPAHILKDVDVTKLYQHPFMQKPNVTDGAFKLAEYQKGQYVQLVANKDYFRGAPKLDEIYFKIMPGANITAQLQSGEIDMNNPSVGAIPFEDYDKVKSMSNLTVESGGTPASIQRLMINVKSIADVRVHKAISLAINRKMIAENLLKGEGEALELPYWSGSPFVNKSIAMSPYDPEAAKQLLQQAGWDANRVLEFDVPVGDKVREQVADIVVENLKAVGINVKVQKYDFVTALSKAKKGEFDLFIVGIQVNPTIADLSTVLQTGGSLNFTKYSNPEVDELITAAQNEVEPAKIKQLNDKVQEIFARDLPTPCLYYQNQLRAVSKRVVVGKPKAFGAFINIQEWDVKN